jgi:hypothetical protein
MDLHSFVLGIVSVVVLSLISVIVYTFFKVNVFDNRFSYVDEKIRKNFEQLLQENKTISNDMMERLRDTHRNIDQRFDKFENRLNVSCFKETKEKQERLYS